MLEQAEVNVGILLTWIGATFGTAVLTINLIHYTPGLGFVGLASVVLTCAHALRLTLLKRDRLMREAFELGRDHERLKSVRSMH